MGYFPVFLEIQDRSCLVVGGGEVAEGKIEALLEAGAKVTVVSPTQTQRIKTWSRGGRLGIASRPFRAEDLDGHDLVFIATNDRDLNQTIHRLARARRIWVNAADDPDSCDFILPAVLRRGALAIAVSTGGLSPALARAIREELEKQFGDEYAALVEIVAEVRQETRRLPVKVGAQEWRVALDDCFVRLVRERRRNEAKAYLKERLGKNPCGQGRSI
jgi:precorrin-2 dehydrogenase/sirohydrochlorin ferrochelatase